MAAETAERPAGSFARASLAAGTLHGVGGVLLAVTGVLIARALGPDDRGVYALVALTATVVAYGSVIGIDLYATQQFGKLGRSRAVERIVRSHASALALLAVAAAGVVLLVVPNGSRSIVGAGLVFAVSSAISALAVARPLGLGRMGVYSTVLLVEAVVPFLVAAACLAFDVRSVPIVLLGFALGRLAGACVSVAGTRRVESRGVVDDGSVRYAAAIRFGVPVAAGALLGIGMLRADAVVVEIFRGTSAVGVYTAVAVLTELLLLVPNGVAAVLLPRVAANPDADATCAVVRIGTSAVALAGVVLAVLGPWVVPLVLGPEYAGGWVALPGLVVAAVFLCAWNLLVADLAGRSVTSVRISSGAVAVAAMLAVDLVTVPMWGIVGASVGAAFGYACAAIMVARRWCTTTGTPWTFLLGARTGDLLLVRRRLHEMLRGRRHWRTV